MANTIEYNIKVNDQDAIKSLSQLENELAQINEELRDVPVGSKAFEDLSKEAQGLTKQLDKANQAAEGFTDDKKFMAADGAIKVLAGSLSGVVGALGAIGFESEVFGEFEKKAASAIAVAIGIKDVSEGFNQLRQSTVLATAASDLFGKVTKRALIATGIGAFVVALGTIVAYWDEINAAVKNGLGVQEDYNDELTTQKELSDGIISVLESQIGLEQAKGLSTLESNKKLLDQLKLQIDITNQLIQQKQIELADEQAQNAELTFWEKLKVGIFQVTGAYGAAGKALADGLNPASEKTKELQTEINDLQVQSNNLQTKYASVLGTVTTQQEMAAGGAQKVETATRGVVQVGELLTTQLQNNVTAFGEVEQAQAKNAAAENLAESQRQLAISQEEDRQRGIHESAQAITVLSAVLGRESTAAKALAISTALINTYLGVTEALKQESTLPSPFDVITKIANVATILTTGLGAVKAIKSTPARGGGGMPGNFRVGAMAASPSPSTPAAPENVGLVPQTLVAEPTVRAYVLSGDVTSNQEAEAKLNTKRTIS